MKLLHGITTFNSRKIHGVVENIGHYCTCQSVGALIVRKSKNVLFKGTSHDFVEEKSASETTS